MILKVECINDNWGLPAEIMMYVPLMNGGKRLPNRYWVAEITGPSDKYKFERKFLKFQKSYAEANSVGTRGIYAYYILQENKIYEVCSPISWNRDDRYFCTIQNDKIVRLTKEEVENISWLKTT